MNPFDLKVALLTKHAQHPVINPHTHGVEHGSNVWLANSKLPHLACVREVASSPSCQPICYFFDNNKEYLTRFSVWRYARRSTGVLTKQQTNQQLEVNICSELSPFLR